MTPTVAHCVSLPAPRGGCVPRLRACSAGLDGTQKGFVSQPGACGPAKPVPRPLLALQKRKLELHGGGSWLK
jgi:hypothetical protein